MSGTSGLLSHHPEELLLLLLGQKLLLVEKMVNDEFLHLALAGHNIFLFRADCLAVRLRRGDQVYHLSASAVGLLADRAGAVLELHQARLDLSPLRVGRAEPTV